MKVRIIQANGIKEIEYDFNLELLKQFAEKYAIVPNTSTTGDYVTTSDNYTTTGNFLTYSSLGGTTINNGAFCKISSQTS